MRLGLCFVIALIFQSMTGVIVAVLWVAAYVFLQVGERLLFQKVDDESGFARGERIALLIVLAFSNSIRCFRNSRGFNGGVWGLLCAGLLWSGAIVNGAMVSGESKMAFATSIGPPLLAFCSVPFFVIGNGGTLAVGLTVVAAGFLNAVGSVAMWAASLRLLAGAARSPGNRPTCSHRP